MFACAIYNLTPAFEENIIAELTDNIRRLRHHASLGIWCGNNELEWQMYTHEYSQTPRQQSDYVKIFEYIIPKTIQANDPDTFSGRLLHLRVEGLMIRMMPAEEMHTIGTCGIRTNHLQSIESTYSDM